MTILPSAGRRPLVKPSEHFIIDDMPRRSTSMAPSFVRSYDDDEYDKHLKKKSVLAMVKEKATKWRNTLSSTKTADENSTPAWGVSLEEEDDDDEENPQYRRAPMYESEPEPEPPKYKDTGRSLSTPCSGRRGKNHVRLLVVKDKEQESKKITESVTNILAPAYAIVSGATHMLASIIQAPLTVATAVIGEETSSKENGDEGISKEADQKQKVEASGEEERAPSQLNSEALSVRKANDDKEGVKGLVEMVKEAESSQQYCIEEEPSKATLTSNPSADIVEEKEERRLQTN